MQFLKTNTKKKREDVMGVNGDRKGVSISICYIPSIDKTIVRKNYTEKGKKKTLIKIFNISYPSIHSEIRILLTILHNKYYLRNIINEGVLTITNIRYSPSGKLAKSSKPCNKCIKVFKIFKNKYKLKRITFIYHENNQIKELYI